MKVGTLIKETKYLEFEVIEVKPKTLVIGIFNKSKGEEIGWIGWYSPWRQYCFETYNSIIWNNTCINDIVGVIDKLMEDRKK